MSKEIANTDMDDVICNYIEAYKKVLVEALDVKYPKVLNISFWV
jgi:hypothetical protein